MKGEIAKTGILLVIISLVCKVFGFIREILIANYYGTTYVVDAFVMATSIPTILFGWLPAISVGFTPIYYQLKDSEKHNYTSRVLCITIFISFVAAIFSTLFCKPITHFVAPGFDGDKLDLTVKLFTIGIWIIIFNTPIQILMAYLNCNNSFVSSAITSLCLSITQAIFVFFSYIQGNSLLLSVGLVVSYAVQFCLLLPPVLKRGFKFKFSLKVDKYIRELMIILLPMFFSYTLSDLNTFVDRLLASNLGEGSIAALNYANMLRNFLMLSIMTAVISIFYPKISLMLSKKKYEDATNAITQIFVILIYVFVPITIGSIIMASPLIKGVLLRGAFNQESLELTRAPFIMYVISLLFASLRDVIIKIFFAFKDSKTNMIYSFFSVLFNILFSLLLIGYLGHSGLALGTSLSCFIILILYYMKLKAKLHFTIDNCIACSFFHALIAALLMSAILYVGTHFAKLMNNALSIVWYIDFISVVLFGICVYVLVMSFIDIQFRYYLKKIFRIR